MMKDLLPILGALILGAALQLFYLFIVRPWWKAPRQIKTVRRVMWVRVIKDGSLPQPYLSYPFFTKREALDHPSAVGAIRVKVRQKKV